MATSSPDSTLNPDSIRWGKVLQRIAHVLVSVYLCVQVRWPESLTTCKGAGTCSACRHLGLPMESARASQRLGWKQEAFPGVGKPLLEGLRRPAPVADVQ